MKIDFNKSKDGLVPAIIQDSRNAQVLMLGYMNSEALEKTISENRVTFYSRSKKRLWTKGETSGNYLEAISIKKDCDSDSLLIKVIPKGDVCHLDQYSCFGDKEAMGFIHELDQLIAARKNSAEDASYTKSLFNSGINKIAQKVGEEAVELIIEAKDNNQDLFKNEAADLLYHMLVLLRSKNISFIEIEKVLAERHSKSTPN